MTDYERYQLEWMIAHGHSLGELISELTSLQNDLEATPGVNLTVNDVYDTWEQDHGFEGEMFACEAEYNDAKCRLSEEARGQVSSREETAAIRDAVHDVLTVDYESSYGERYKLALYRDTYVDGGELAVAALDVTDPNSEDYMEPWGTLTVNVPDDPEAAAWCATRGNVVIDTNNNSKELVDALVGAGIIALAGDSCRSGFCVYPLAAVAPSAMEAMVTYAETVERLTDDRQEEPQQEAFRDDGRGYSLASIEREVRHVPERGHDGGPCPPGGPER